MGDASAPPELMILRSLTIVVLLVLLPGCTLFFGGGGGGGNPECRVDLDCGQDIWECRDGVCAERCDGVACDTGLGELCEPTTGGCTVPQDEACGTLDPCSDPSDVCEGGRCRGGAFDSCGALDPCGAGLDCLPAASGFRCLAPCSTPAECSVTERCLDASFGRLANHCAPNLCRPGGDPENSLVQDAQWAGACAAAGPADGWCLGPVPDGRGGTSGLCVGVGDAATGEGCVVDARHGAPDACDRGWCVPSAGGAETGECMAFCSVWTPGVCQADGDTGRACFGLWGGQGLCYPTADPLGVAGDECTPPEEGYLLVCEAGTLCISEGLDGEPPHRCLSYCDPDAPAGAGPPWECEMGRCVAFDPRANPGLGLCVDG